MISERQFLVKTIDSLEFPADVSLPTKYFRLLLAADLNDFPAEQLLACSRQLIERGMVYFCAWGEDCERMHDCVDEEVVALELSGRLFAHPMTTWHANESLEEATTFFRDAARPHDEFEAESRFWLALVLRSETWATAIQSILAE